MTKQAAAKQQRPLKTRLLRLLWKIPMWFFIITISWVLLYKWINPPTTWLHLTCDCPKGSTFHKQWVDDDEIALNMKLAVVASEDNNFMKHSGIDWGAVEKAKKYNETIGKKKGKTRGASTITQQTAKNVFLWPARSWLRKGLEVYFTYLIEFFWSKQRIMEVYLNVIEMGPCKFGVGAASKDYFNTSATKLSKEQAALIAACLPNPKKYNVAHPGGYMQKRQGQIVRLMRMIGDNYFTRYGTNTDESVREKEEKETEKKIESLPKEELPEKIEVEENEAEMIDIEKDSETNAMEQEEVKPDSTEN